MKRPAPQAVMMLMPTPSDEPSTPIPLEYRGPGIKRRKPHWRFWWMYLIAIVVAVLIIFVLILPPAQNGSHVTSMGICTMNLHQLGLDIELYSQDYQGQFPDSLAVMVMSLPVEPKSLICPNSTDIAAVGATTQQVAAELQKPDTIHTSTSVKE